MPDVVLLYQRECPNVLPTRANLMRAFSQASVNASWRELDLDDGETPSAFRRYGSPTVLIDGRDVAGEEPCDGATCRLYRDGPRTTGAPSVDMIAACLAASPAPRASLDDPPSPSPPPSRSIGSTFASVPGLLIALLPKGLCPACWPAYAAVLSALGLGFLMQDRYLLPLTIVFLALATWALTYRARARRGFAPAVAGALFGAVLVIGKFALDAPAVAYLGVAGFTAAAIWNAWPVRRASCPACIPTPVFPSRT